MKKAYTVLHYCIAAGFILCLHISVCFGQAAPVSSLKNTLSSLSNITEKLPVEKLYLQTDKPYYTGGDTLRFKAYLLNGDYLTPSANSGLLYVELDDANNFAVKRIMVPVNGVGWGNIALNAKDVPEGNYTLRAYTNWMRNFGEDYIFKKSVYISALNAGATLVNTAFKLQKLADKTNVQASLRFTKLDKDALRLRDMQIWVKDGNKTLFKDKASTHMDGGMDINFNLADKADINRISIQVQEIKKDEDAAKLTIPVIINRSENTDLQFMPEGGSLVAGIASRIGFKAISEDGKAAAVKGKIYNSKQQEITGFQSAHLGMGSLEFTPEVGENYTAKLELPGNIIKSYPLPQVSATGTALSIQPKGADSLEITLNSTPNQSGFPAVYYLVGQSRGIVCYAATIHFVRGKIKLIAAKNLFPTGITRFTLLNNVNQPVNERVVYVDHQDNLQIKIAGQRSVYNIRDSVALSIQVTDKEGKPVKGTFSLAVTDDSQVKPDSIGSNIGNHFLLTSELKGTVEQPGYYFADNGSVAKPAELDDLLLTQGWVGYDWKQVFDAKPLSRQYKAESEFTIQGRVVNVFNKPVPNSEVMIFSKKPEIIKDTVTDKNGRFTFKGIFPVDTAIFKLQAKNKRGKSFNVDLIADEFVAPVFKKTQQTSPWYVNSDSTLLNNANTQIAKAIAIAIYNSGHLLKEVVIKDKRIIKYSKNLNGEDGADEVLDEKDMEKVGKATLMQILQKIKGFGEGKNDDYQLHLLSLHLIIDGINVEQFQEYGTFKDRHDLLKSYLDYITAEDILGIEIMYSGLRKTNYDLAFYFDLVVTGGPPPFAYVEITTRSGNGAFMKHTPGTLLLKPLPFTLAKQFYSPRYTVNNSKIALGTDLRSTIHWEPNIATDANGKATISFYSADTPANYSVVIEGTDLTGQVGFKREKLLVHNSTGN